MNTIDSAALKKKILHSRAKVSALIFGDILLDTYIFGSVNRISPEAPVPVLNVDSEKSVLGGAANVAANLIALGADVFLCGTCAPDAAQKELFALLENAGIQNHLIVNDFKPTITKSRIVAANQQMLRIDREKLTVLPQELEHALYRTFETILLQKPINVIVISDYDKGTCTQYLCEKLNTLAHQHGIPLLVDPKGTDWQKYHGSDFITPNLKELNEIAKTTLPNNLTEIQQPAMHVKDQFAIQNLLVTRAEKGMTLFGDDEIKTVDTLAKEVFDVCGAGDTVISTLAFFIGLQNFTAFEAVQLANLAAGISVAHFGTYAVSLSEIIQELPDHSENEKILLDSTLEQSISVLKQSGKKIVFTNGCFDILHIGHLRYLLQAHALGDVLIVGLNADSSVKKLKGKNRPINNEAIRAEMLCYLPFIDYVIIFPDETPYEIIKTIQPDILVKGGDYKIEDIVGREFAKTVQTIPFVDGYSTSAILEKSAKT